MKNGASWLMGVLAATAFGCSTSGAAKTANGPPVGQPATGMSATEPYDHDIKQSVAEGGVAPGQGVVQGVVADVGAGALKVKSRDGTVTPLLINAKTQVLVDGKAAQVQSLQQGEDVRASWQRTGNDLVATEIAVQRNAANGASTGR